MKILWLSSKFIPVVFGLCWTICRYCVFLDCCHYRTLTFALFYMFTLSTNFISVYLKQISRRRKSLDSNTHVWTLTALQFIINNKMNSLLKRRSTETTFQPKNSLMLSETLSLDWRGFYWVSQHCNDPAGTFKFNQFTDQTAYLLTDRTADHLTDRTANYLTDRTADHLMDRTADSMTDRTADCLIEQMNTWSNGWSPDWSNSWSPDWTADHLTLGVGARSLSRNISNVMYWVL